MESQSEGTIVEFARYNVWANLRLLKTCEGLSAAQLQTSAPGAYGTIYDTLVHIIQGENLYIKLLGGPDQPPPFRWEDKPAVADIRRYAEQRGPALIDTMRRANPDDIVRQQWEGGVDVYRAVTVLIQLINHGVEHRTNVTTILAALGVATPEIDGWGYMWANRDRLGDG
ncbi:MAG: DinB family protein [Chloroflexi bacterium]|nr:DinB family protein [Chloroflexota bacterium]MCL5274105.1 DinB family protein [Chloroflexota bacterium]